MSEAYVPNDVTPFLIMTGPLALQIRYLFVTDAQALQRRRLDKKKRLY